MPPILDHRQSFQNDAGTAEPRTAWKQSQVLLAALADRGGGPRERGLARQSAYQPSRFISTMRLRLNSGGNERSYLAKIL